MRILPLVLLFVPLFVLAACSSQYSREPGEPLLSQTKDETSPKRWYEARFEINWPSEERPDWGLAALLASEVVRPVLNHPEVNLSLWRFHRRAARDRIGHTFRFVFYCSDPQAALIRDLFVENQVVPILLENQILNDFIVSYSALGRAPLGVAGTSDPQWPEEIQAAWPYFAMGVSLTWLALIEQCSEEKGLQNVPMNMRLNLYREAHQEVLDLWRSHGQHAFLHHLNALFAYEPVKIKKEMRF